MNDLKVVEIDKHTIECTSSSSTGWVNIPDGYDVVETIRKGENFIYLAVKSVGSQLSQ